MADALEWTTVQPVSPVEVHDERWEYLGELEIPGYVLYRANVRGLRVYFTWDTKTKTVILYNNGTNAVSNYKEPYDALAEWKVSTRLKGIDPNVFANYRANLGTIMHILGGLLFRGELDGKTDAEIYQIIRDMNVSTPENRERIITWEMQGKTEMDMVWHQKGFLINSILSLCQWAKDFNFKPLAIELMLKSDTLMIGTPLDLIGYIDVKEKGFWGEKYKADSKRKDGTESKKGDPKESYKMITKLVIVDWKSGKNFYTKNIFQLMTNKIIFEENYPDMKVDGIYNWRPTFAKGKPGYSFVEQSGKSVAHIFDNVVERGRLEFEIRDHSVRTRTSEIKFGTDFDDVQIYTNNPLHETIRDHMVKMEEAKAAALLEETTDLTE